jgi:hypothetical protein
VKEGQTMAEQQHAFHELVNPFVLLCGRDSNTTEKWQALWNPQNLKS